MESIHASTKFNIWKRKPANSERTLFDPGEKKTELSGPLSCEPALLIGKLAVKAGARIKHSQRVKAT